MTTPAQSPPVPDAQALREEARERILRSRPELAQMKAGEIEALVQELEIHQVELEVQNEELRRSQIELSEARSRYQDLYENAPVGYLELEEGGVVRRANLAAAQLCDTNREQMLGRRIEEFVTPEDCDACYLHLRAARSSEGASCRVRLQGTHRSAVWVHMKSVVSGGTAEDAAACTYRVTLIDVTAETLAEAMSVAANTQLEDAVNERTRDLRHALEDIKSRSRQLTKLVAQLHGAEERERTRIAQILHDDLQQTLVGIRFQLDAIAFGKDRPELRTISDLLQGAIEASRGLSHELSPPPLVRENLSSAALWLAREMRRNHGLQVEIFVDEGADAASDQIRSMVFRALRELIFNVIKHAGVAAATVHIQAITSAELHIEVSDLGVGINTEPANDPGGGLLTLRERFELIGGRLEIESQAGRGTTVRIVSPMHLPD